MLRLYLPYNLIVNPDDSYTFTSSLGYQYLIYFSEATLPDAEGNVHLIYNVGFSKDGRHNSSPFIGNYDGRVRVTITHLINTFFKKNEHRVLVYFCFGDDGYSRNRNIVFNQWFKDLDSGIEKYNHKLSYEGDLIYGALIIASDNPLKKLILDAFEYYLKDLQQKDQ